ncbi:putative transcriptional regulator [Enterococcus rotai]|uniref:helix-turn-helix transcriptional regulator n=1 Tax=Enterococcus rotai TaxID=118060 RepID=UPI003399CE96
MGKSKIVETHIHVYRAIKRMSQSELAKKIGVSRVTIVNIELNRQNPSVITMYDISRVLGTTIEELFTFETQEEE